MNPFFQEYNTPFETIPFSKITLEHFKPAVEEGIKLSEKEIKEITHNTSTASFENTIVALENAGDILSKVTSVFFNLNSAETSQEMQALAQDLSPLLTAHSNDIAMNSELFARVKTVFEKGQTALTEEQKTLLEKSYKGFTRNGANLIKSDKEKLRKIDQELATLSLTFGENVLKESNAFEMLLCNEQELDGLPQGIKDSALAMAKAKEKEGWLFTLDYPSYIPFMTYSSKRNLREKMYKAFSSKAIKSNENNNAVIINNLTKLRAQRAKLLGFTNHAEYVLAERMAKTPNKVLSFLDKISSKALPFAKTEFETLKDYAKKLDGIDKLEKWDGGYYAEKLKKEKFNIDDELLRPYFQLDKVIAGVFKTAEKLFGITFNKITDIDKYHQDVITYEVQNQDGRHLAIFYADFFPRPGKRQGAWMTNFRGQKKLEKQDQRPHVSIVCNFTKPTEKKPSLLTFNEVTTLFHEFGHALHGILANGNYESLSGTSVYWDFVELPSQLMENWCYEKECLDLFAKHFETGDSIPKEYIQKIKDSANFMSGMATVRQISLGKLDMGWHTLSPDNDQYIDVQAFENQAIKGLDFYPNVKESCTSTSFSHIFQGGYSSGYYSYKWAEVLDADAFEAFLEKGIFNKEVADSFKNNILSAGGSEHPSILWKRFRRRDAKPDALLKRAGLITSS